jgi:hypothetical protein
MMKINIALEGRTQPTTVIAMHKDAGTFPLRGLPEKMKEKSSDFVVWQFTPILARVLFEEFDAGPVGAMRRMWRSPPHSA